jgi:hypothetical protein
MTRFPLTLAAAVSRGVRQLPTGPCVGCGKPLSLMVFRWNGKSRHEDQRRVTVCADCQRAERKAKRRQPLRHPMACAQ